MGHQIRIRGIDIAVFTVLPLVAAWISISADTPYLASIILFYATPGIYAAFRFASLWQVLKGLLFSAITAPPFTILVDYIGTVSGVWTVPSSAFSSRLLGVIPFEDMLWMFCATFTIVLLYQVLVDKGKRELVDRRMIYFAAPAILALIAFLFALSFGYGELFEWQSRYAYLVLGSVFFLLPSTWIVWQFPRLLVRSGPLIGYFFFVTVVFEIVATYLNQWIFTGEYLLKPLNLGSGMLIPLEELFFVGIVGPLAVVAFYEFFDDDRRNS